MVIDCIFSSYSLGPGLAGMGLRVIIWWISQGKQELGSGNGARGGNIVHTSWRGV